MAVKDLTLKPTCKKPHAQNQPTILLGGEEVDSRVRFCRGRGSIYAAPDGGLFSGFNITAGVEESDPQSNGGGTRLLNSGAVRLTNF